MSRQFVKKSARSAKCRIRAGSAIIPVHTIFFGGGTPSLLSAAQLGTILDHAARSSFDFQDEMEITLEANPGTVSPEYLHDLRRLGINRLSFGMQSAHPDDLRLLERQHDFFDVVQAVEWARKAGFDNLSLDLIFGLPGQDLAALAGDAGARAGDGPGSSLAVCADHRTRHAAAETLGARLDPSCRR